MKTVILPNNVKIKFPDEMSDQEISSYIDSNSNTLIPYNNKDQNLQNQKSPVQKAFSSKTVIKSPNAIGNASDFLEGAIQGVSNVPANYWNTLARGVNPAFSVYEKSKFGKNSVPEMQEFDFAPKNFASFLGQVAPSFVGPIAAESTANYLKPSNLIAQSVSKRIPLNKLNFNFSAAEGTNAPLPYLTESPTLKRIYENVAGPMPFSGETKKSLKFADQLKEKGQNLLDSLYQGNKENIGQTLQKALKKSYFETLAQKNKNWNELSKIAESKGIKIGRQNLLDSAIKNFVQIHESPELMNTTSPELIKDLKFLILNSKESPSYNIKNSNIFRSKLKDKQINHSIENNNFEAGIYGKLEKALKKDIYKKILGEKNGVDYEILNAFQKANDYHKNYYAPFEDENLQKYIKKGGDSDLIISHFLKKGSNDRANLLSKLIEKLPENEKGALAYGYFSQGMPENEFSPQVFLKNYKNLGKKQKNILFDSIPNKLDFDKYAFLTSQSAFPLNKMANPPTGQTLKDVAALYALYQASQHGGVPGAAAVGALPIAAKGFTELMTSPKFRKKIYDRILELKENSPKNIFEENKWGK